MVVAIEKIISYFYIILGLSLLVRPKLWIKLLENTFSKPGITPFTFIVSILGIVVVVFHNIWVWHPSVIITIIGWGALFKGIFYFLYPELSGIILSKFKKMELLLRVDGIFLILISIWVLSTHSI